MKAWGRVKADGSLEESAVVIGRLEKLVDGLDPDDVAKRGWFAKQNLGFLLDTVEIPDSALKQNLYGVGFGIARRKHLGIHGPSLAVELENLTAEQVQECMDEYLDPDKRVISVVK